MESTKSYREKIFLHILVSLTWCFCAVILSSQTVFAESSQVVSYENKLQDDFDGDGVYQEFFVQGVEYAPFPIGRAPDQSNLIYPTNVYDNTDILHRDFSMLSKMYANTITVFYANQHDGSLDHLTTQTLDLAENYSMKVIAGYHVPVTMAMSCVNGQMAAAFSLDITDPVIRKTIVNDYAKFVGAFDNHPGILFWAIHADDDFSLKYASADQKQAWFSLINEMARAGKNAEGVTWHPVAMVDYYFDGLGIEGVGIDSIIPDVDFIGVHALGFVDVDSILTAYKAASAKPMWMAGFGADAWLTQDEKKPERGASGEKEQAQIIGDIWNTLISNKNGLIGASVHTYGDAFWKRGTADAHDYDGTAGWDFTCPADGEWDKRPAAVDQFFNDEWWGIVTFVNDPLSPNLLDQAIPRSAYYILQQAFSFGNDSLDDQQDGIEDDIREEDYRILMLLRDQTVTVQETLVMPVKSNYGKGTTFVITLGNGDPISYIGASFQTDASGGKFIWTPGVEYADTIHPIKFSVYHNGTLKETKVIFIYVEARNHKPIAQSQVAMVQQNGSVAITLEANDPDGDRLNYIVTIKPQYGKLSGAFPNVVYTPEEDYVGSDHFAFEVNDGRLSSQQAHVGIIVAPDEAYHSGYVDGQVIVKFRATGPYAVPYDLKTVFNSDKSFEEVVPRSGEAIDQIIKKYKVNGIEPVYRYTEHEVDDEMTMTTVDDLRSAEQEYQERQQMRYRPGDKGDSDQTEERFHTYVIKFDKSKNVLDVIKAFAKLPHVEVVRGNNMIQWQDTDVQEKNRKIKTKKERFLDKLKILREGS